MSDRRRFLLNAPAIALGFSGLGHLSACADQKDTLLVSGYGPLLKDPKRILELPKGFSYQVVGRSGEKMEDGFFVPAAGFQGECIDCDACVEACPVDACFAEDQLPEEWAKYTQTNAEYYTQKAAG